MTINAYATVEELSSRWRPIGEDERHLAETLLEDASAILDASVDVDALDDRKAALVPVIVCDMVRRAMGGEQPASDPFGAPDQFSAWESMTPARKPYLTKRDLAALGASSKTARIGL